jgi:peroxiredoxin
MRTTGCRPKITCSLMRTIPSDFARATCVSLLLATTAWAQNPAPATSTANAAVAPVAAPAKVLPPFREDFGKLKNGELVPDFDLQSAGGKPAKFSSYAAGKVVVIGIWGAGIGGPAPMMAQWEALAKKYREAGVVFLGIGSYGSREEFDQWQAKNAGKFSFPVAFDPAGKVPSSGKPRDQMTPDEIKAQTAISKEYYAKTISMRLGGVIAPYPTTIVVNAERKVVGWFSGYGASSSEGLANLLLRAGVKLAAEDMPAKVFSPDETKMTAPAAPRMAMLTVGTVAPDFTTIDLAGKPVKLSDYRGKVVVLDFWATWCGPCIASMPHTNEVAAHYRDQGVVVLGSCTSDTRAAFEKWVKANQEKYPDFIFSHDPAERTPASVSQKLYGVSGIPQQFVIGRDGKIAALVTGYLKGEVLLEGALAKAGIKVADDIVAKAKVDQAKRDAESGR